MKNYGTTSNGKSGLNPYQLRVKEAAAANQSQNMRSLSLANSKIDSQNQESVGVLMNIA
jgi:hypothetical protein